MNEVEKLYRNCGLVETIKHHNFSEHRVKDIPFTAEKQIELIKWLAHKDSYSCNYSEIKPRDNNEEWMSYSVFKAGFAHSFEEALASLVDHLWQDLTEEERKQIKEILSE